MLNRAERLRIFGILRIWSIVGLLPTQADLVSRRLNVPCRKKQFLSLVSYCLFILHTLDKSASLAYSFFFVPDIQLHQLVIHAVLAMASVVGAFWFHSAYLRNPARFFSYMNMSLLGNTGGPLLPNDELERDWTIRIWEYSLQDLVAKGLPYMAIAGMAVIIASFVYDPSMRLLLYAVLPSHLQNWATFGFCLLEELRFMVICNSIVTPILQTQVTSFDIVTKKLRLMAQKMGSGRQNIGEAYGHLRALQLYLTVLNNVNMYLIFTWKLLSISCSVFSGYAAIAHFHEYPIFGIMYYVILFDVIFSYTSIYENAFKIPEVFGQVAGCALLHMRGSRRDGVLRRQFKAIPRTGVRVGQFHQMERASTLIYVDFVVKNVVNMLVAYG